MNKKARISSKWWDAFMGRPPRLQFEDAFYHVYSRGNRRERTFLEDSDYHEFEEVILDQAVRSEVNLYSWCPMPNHFHLAVDTPHANLSSFMQRVLTSYARYFNLKYKKVGHVFQGRYGSKLVDREEYLMELVRYIHLNPYRVKNSSWKVPEGGWPWSSHRYYVDGHEPSVAAPFIHAVLRRFSDDIETARKRYAAFVADGLATGRWQAFYKIKEGRFIGNDSWVAETKAGLGEPISRNPLPLWPEFEALLLALANETGLAVGRLVSDERSREISKIRQMFVFMAVRLWKQSQTATAQVLRKDASSVSHLLRSSTLRREHPIIQRVLARISAANMASCG